MAIVYPCLDRLGTFPFQSKLGSRPCSWADQILNTPRNQIHGKPDSLQSHGIAGRRVSRVPAEVSLDPRPSSLHSSAASPFTTVSSSILFDQHPIEQVGQGKTGNRRPGPRRALALDVSCVHATRVPYSFTCIDRMHRTPGGDCIRRRADHHNSCLRTRGRMRGPNIHPQRNHRR